MEDEKEEIGNAEYLSIWFIIMIWVMYKRLIFYKRVPYKAFIFASN